MAKKGGGGKTPIHTKLIICLPFPNCQDTSSINAYICDKHPISYCQHNVWLYGRHRKHPPLFIKLVNFHPNLSFSLALTVKACRGFKVVSGRPSLVGLIVYVIKYNDLCRTALVTPGLEKLCNEEYDAS